MIGALIILLLLIAVGAVLYMFHRRDVARGSIGVQTGQTEETAAPSEECCGMHIVCEKDSLLAAVDKEIIYYDDEELDRFKGRGAEEYTDDEIEEFRDVLLTLLPQDIAGWGRSMQQREIVLPSIVKEELLLIVAEEREAHTKN